MPRRTNEFQSLVFELTRQLQPLGAKIEESRLLTDKTTGETREVDVTVEVPSGAHRLLLCFEAYSGGRRATVEWVDTMHAKYDALNTNKLVLVSKAGFTKAALQKAKHHGHDAMSVAAAGEVDWKSVVDTIPHLGIRATILPRIRRILLDVSESDRTRAEAITDFTKLRVQIPDNDATILWKYVRSLLHSPGFIDRFVRALPANRPTILRGDIAVPDRTVVIDDEHGEFALRTIYVEAEVQRIEQTLPIERYAFGDETKIAMGRGRIDQFPLTMSVAQVRDEDTEVRVRFQTAVGSERLEIINARFVAE